MEVCPPCPAQRVVAPGPAVPASDRVRDHHPYESMVGYSGFADESNWGDDAVFFRGRDPARYHDMAV